MSKILSKAFGYHHAYSGSSTKMWLTCTKSIPAIIADVKSGKITNQSTSFASEQGTAAHMLGEKCLEKGFKPIQFMGKKFNKFVIDEDFVEAVTVYVDRVNGLVKENKDSVLTIEEKFEIKEYTKADSGGSADAKVVSIKAATLNIDDYKHGKGLVVEAEENTQLMFYGACALLSLKPSVMKKIKKVNLTIVQPRAYHPDGAIRTYTIRARKLLRWFFDVVIPAIEISESGKGEFVASEEGCFWCPRSGYCTANNESAFSTMDDDFKDFANGNTEPPKVESLTKEQLLDLMENRDRVVNYFNKVFYHAKDLMDKGESFDGFKLIKGMSNRKFKDTDKLDKALMRKGVEEYYETPAIKSPAQLEKHLKINAKWRPKKIKRFMERITERTETNSRLVRENDFGESAGNSLENDFKEFRK